MDELGIKPAAFLGHSMGEFAAAHLSGIMSLEDVLMLVTSRAQLISKLPEGKMLAVRAAAAQLEDILPAALAIAAKNSPNLTVVSGPAADIVAFVQTLTAQGIPSMLLNTSHAMHSAMVEPTMQPFKKLVDKVQLHAPRIPFISTVTGQWLSEAEATSAEYWVNNMRQPVEFITALQTANDESNRILLECGPGNVLSTLAKNQVDKSKQQVILPGITENASAYNALLNTLGQLWLNGMEPNWQQFYAGQTRNKVLVPSYAFDHQNYWLAPGKPVAVANTNHTTSSISSIDPRCDK